MKPLIIWIILCLVWGTTWIFIKIGLDDLPPISFAALRFIVSVLVLFPIIFWKKFEFPQTRKEWIIIAISGVLQFFFNYSLLFWGEQHISSGLAAVLQATIPAFGLILARIYIPNEKITCKKVVSILLGLVGLLIIFNEQLTLGGTLAFLGSVAIVVGAFFASYASVLTKTYGTKSNPAVLVCSQMLIGLIPLTITALLLEGNPINFNWTKSAVFSLLYLAIMGSIVAFWLYYWLLTKMDVTKAMMISFVTPVMAILVGAFYRQEQLELQTLFGGIFILASILLSLFKLK
ncbi:MAG TPA: EamA family transporter [Pyrinomonadaceae bacterium]|nr:EamA family transporter [Pyrinomonadaceae bacterium]